MNAIGGDPHNITALDVVIYQDGKQLTTGSAGATGGPVVTYTGKFNIAANTTPFVHLYTVTVTFTNGLGRKVSRSIGPCVQAAPPYLSEFTPASAPIGATIVLNGTNLQNPSAIHFNGADAVTFAANSDGTQISVVVPVGAVTGVLQVTTSGGVTRSKTFFGVIQPPIISGFTPIRGPVGTTVTLNGLNFGTISSVSFNGVAATQFAPNSSGTLIKVVVPPGATSGPIQVTTAGETVRPVGSFLVTTP